METLGTEIGRPILLGDVWRKSELISYMDSHRLIAILSGRKSR